MGIRYLVGLLVVISEPSIWYRWQGQWNRKAFGNRESRCREGKMRKKLFLWLGSKSNLKTQYLIQSANCLLVSVCFSLWQLILEASEHISTCCLVTLMSSIHRLCDSGNLWQTIRLWWHRWWGLKGTVCGLWLVFKIGTWYNFKSNKALLFRAWWSWEHTSLFSGILCIC